MCTHSTLDHLTPSTASASVQAANCANPLVIIAQTHTDTHARARTDTHKYDLRARIVLLIVLSRANADEAAKKPKRPYRIISFDGGGVKGVFSLRILQRLLEKVPNLLLEADLLAGTSVSGELSAHSALIVFVFISCVCCSMTHDVNACAV